MSIYHKINELIDKSKGEYISLESGEEYFFSRKAIYSAEEITSFQKEKNIHLPKQYCDFLMNVGACNLYFDEYGLGITFYKLGEIFSAMSEIFLNRNNPFPDLLMIGVNLNNGDSIGLDLRIANEVNLSIFSSEEDPDEWKDNIEDFISLNEFLEKLYYSYGEDYYL